MTFKLIARNLLAHPWRTLLTTGSVLLAVLLLCLLNGAVKSMTSSIDEAATNRLWVQSAVSLFVDLPQNYQAKIQSVPGVEHVVKMQWFGGVYEGDDTYFFAQFGIDDDS